MNTLFKKPSKLTGISWFLFAGAATVSAFFLPVFIYGAIHPNGAHNIRPRIISSFILFFVIFCALHLSLYRVKTILLDLGLGKYEKIITISLRFLFTILMMMVVYFFLVYHLFSIYV